MLRQPPATGSVSGSVTGSATPRPAPRPAARPAARRAATVLVPLALLAGTAAVAPAASARALPDESVWRADVVAAMDGSGRYLQDRVARRGSERLAINFDIDNTTLASHYDRGNAVRRVLRFAQRAAEADVALLFNTARPVGDGRMARARRSLERAGYPVTGICGRRLGEGLAESKQRCRQRFVDRGWTLVANIGNRDTDFEGGNYERAFRLPNYGNQLS